MLAKLGFVLLAIGSGLSPGASIISSIEGGSLGKVTKIASNHFRLAVIGETDQAGRNRQASWYYFRVEGAPGTEMIFDMVDLPGEYNFQPNKGAITDKTPPVISYDLKTWTHLTDVSYDAKEPKLTLRIVPKIIKVLDCSHASVHRR